MKKSANWLWAGLPTMLAGCCCKPVDYVADCETNRGNEIVLIAGAAQLQAKPECLEVDGGEEVTFIRRPASGITIQTFGKVSPQDDWLDSGEREAAVVTAPPEPATTNCEDNVCEHGYRVVVPDVGELDPRVRVRY